jgi:hypothetical protein
MSSKARVMRIAILLLAAVAFCAGNPIIERLLSEVSVNPDHQFVELRHVGSMEPVDLWGWRMVTSLSECTLAHQLLYNEFLVVDSAALASGAIGRGALRLNPLGDSVKLITDSGEVAETVHFPRYPTGDGSAPAPPIAGSVAYVLFNGMQYLSMNWYVDSTSTPGAENDDYSTIVGSVVGSGGETPDAAVVVVSGPCRGCHDELWRASSFGVVGLSAGAYEVSVRAYFPDTVCSMTYPDSVTVGYDQVVSGINFVVPLAGVAEPTVDMVPEVNLQQHGRTLVLTAGRPGAALVTVCDNLGRVRMSEEIALAAGRNEAALPSLGSGVYFATCRFRNRTLTHKLLLY